MLLPEAKNAGVVSGMVFQPACPSCRKSMDSSKKTRAAGKESGNAGHSFWMEICGLLQGFVIRQYPVMLL